MLLVKPLCFVAVIAWLIWLIFSMVDGYVGGEAVVTDAGHLVIGERTVHLLGVDSLAVDQSCTFASRKWSCGSQAVAVVHRWIGLRTVRCLPEGRTVDGFIEGLCYAGTDEVGRWVVRSGWALADRGSGGRYVAEESEARSQLAGIWGSSFVIPRLWRERAVLGRESAEGREVAEFASDPWWRIFIPLFGCLVTAFLLIRWFPSVGRRFLERLRPSHRWRVDRSIRLLEQLRRIGRERGAGAQFAYLRKVDPLVVEELVLSGLASKGHTIRRNERYSGDGGVDGRCWIDGVLHLIQVKRYGSYIRVEHVREFAALCSEAGAKGLFVHTGRTGPAALECADAGVTIVSGSRLLQLLGVIEERQEPYIGISEERKEDDGNRTSEVA